MYKVIHLIASLLLIGPAAADTIRLANGNEITGEIVDSDEGRVVFDHPQLGTLEIARAGIAQVRRAEDAGSEAASASADPSEIEYQEREDGDDSEEEEQQHDGLFGTRILEGWDSSIGIGLTGSAGGFEDTKLSVLAATSIENERRIWSFDSAYFFNVTPKRDGQDEKVSKNQGWVQLRRAWLFADSEHFKKWFVLAQSRYDVDRFQPWRHRIGAHAGPGYNLVDSRKWQVRPMLGFGASYDFGTIDGASPELMLGFDVEWNPTSWNSVTFNNQLFVDVTDKTNHRTNQTLDWRIDVSRGLGLGLRLSALYKFDSESEGKANDLTYLTALDYTF